MQEDLRTLVKISKALADETRFKIFQMICEKGEISCSEIVEAFPVSQPTISHHLKVLTDCGLIDYRKQGQWSYFFINQETLKRYLAQLKMLMLV